MFSPGFGQSPGLADDSKPSGAPSRLAGQVNSPVRKLSTSGLLGASCEKQGKGEGVLYVHLSLVRLRSILAAGTFSE